MKKGKQYPKGCSDLGRLSDHLDKTEKAKRRTEYLQSRKEDKPSVDKEVGK